LSKFSGPSKTNFLHYHSTIDAMDEIKEYMEQEIKEVKSWNKSGQEEG
jgi:galactose-1-phosphate uridylyltransferase